APSRGLLLHFLELLPLGILEGVWGWSPGKRLLRLRVSTANGFDPPGLWRGLLRAGTFYACIWLPSDAVVAIFSRDDAETAPAGVGGFLELIGFVLVISTRRARTGYRGLHEWLSGTRVVRLPWPERRHAYTPRQPDRAAVPFPAPDELPARLGPYHVRGV